MSKMKAIWIKPNINFHLMPAIGLWIQAKYDKVNSREEMVAFIHECFYEAEISANVVRQEWYYKTGSALYGYMTGRAYENSVHHLIGNL